MVLAAIGLALANRRRNLGAFMAPITPDAPVAHTKALRTIALVEAAKGAIVLVIGFGLLSFLGRDADAFAEHLVNRLHLNPAHHYPHVFIQAMTDVTDSGLWMLAGLAALYSLI